MKLVIFTNRKINQTENLVQPGQLLRVMKQKYEYDAEGNLVRKTERDGKVWTYEWNANGMLKSVIRPDKNSVRFTHDALGRRLSKTYLDTCTRWVWDGIPIHEWTEDSTQTTSALTVTSSGELELKPENKKSHHLDFWDGTFSVAKLFRDRITVLWMIISVLRLGDV